MSVWMNQRVTLREKERLKKRSTKIKELSARKSNKTRGNKRKRRRR